MIKTIFFDIGGVLVDINFKKTSQYLYDITDKNYKNDISNGLGNFLYGYFNGKSRYCIKSSY